MKKLGILLILAALAVGLALALTGCGAKETTSSQAPTTVTAATETKPATTAPAPETAPASTTTPAQQPVATETPTAQPEPIASATEQSTPELPATSPQEPATPESPVVQPEVPASETPAAEVDPSATFSKSIQVLKSLSSYRYATMMNYEGTGDSAADSGSVEVHGEYSAPDRYHMTITDSSDGTRSEFVKIGDALWIYDDGEWTKVPEMAVTAMSQSIFIFALDFVWGTLAEGLETGAHFVGNETVNGTKSLHYSSTNSDWEKSIEAGFGNAHGDIWVAEAGYPVKFVFTASGTDEEGNAGSIEWRSDVTDVNTQVTISAPTEE